MGSSLPRSANSQPDRLCIDEAKVRAGQTSTWPKELTELGGGKNFFQPPVCSDCVGGSWAQSDAGLFYCGGFDGIATRPDSEPSLGL